MQSRTHIPVPALPFGHNFCEDYHLLEYLYAIFCSLIIYVVNIISQY